MLISTMKRIVLREIAKTFTPQALQRNPATAETLLTKRSWLHMEKAR
jgi:hypothetical protein